MANVDKQRQHAERLLYSMIPKPTAIRLKNGEDPINTWEVNSTVIMVYDDLGPILVYLA